MKFLGISPAHDSSVCVYEDGKILQYYKEERLSRIKRDSNPVRSFLEVSKDHKNFDGVSWCSVISNNEARETFLEIAKKFSNFSNVVDFSGNHHLQHASLAFYNSGFEKASVIIVDRNGSVFQNSARESETIFYCEYPHLFKEIYKSFWVFDPSAFHYVQEFKKENKECEIDARSMQGIVKVYESATTLIGQNILENGKTMGLSSYGNKEREFCNFFVSGTNIPIDYYFGHYDEASINIELFPKKTKNITEENYQEYADYAWQVQRQTQEAVATLIEKSIEKTGCKNIAISGGYALNVVANSYFLKKFPDVNFYFEPIADDSGNSIGGAMLHYRVTTQDKNIYPIKDTFIHGKEHSLSSLTGDSKTLRDIAEMLSNQKTVAVYNGISEGGQRALGNRSILFDARNPNAKDIVNRVKNREWYRPFAAIVLEEDAHLYFNMNNVKSSPFMTIGFDATEFGIKNVPGVIHVDNTSRIQTVDKSNQLMYNLLKEFKKITGHGILLNTSFNLAGEPLVETPDQAIEVLANSPLDLVWFPQREIALEKDGALR